MLAFFFVIQPIVANSFCLACTPTKRHGSQSTHVASPKKHRGEADQGMSSKLQGISSGKPPLSLSFVFRAIKFGISQNPADVPAVHTNIAGLVEINAPTAINSKKAVEGTVSKTTTAVAHVLEKSPSGSTERLVAHFEERTY